jgi:hypothetical protein
MGGRMYKVLDIRRYSCDLRSVSPTDYRNGFGRCRRYWKAFAYLQLNMAQKAHDEVSKVSV